MASNQQDPAPSISPVLFMTVDGQPMSFFLRPGPVKRKLQPLITAGGGVMCNIQQPGTILLMDPGEKKSVPESATHWYVSTQYIHECIEKEEQLNLEDYRLNLDVQRQSPRLNRSKDDSSKLSGRIAYTSEEDAAILNYVSKRNKETGGNRLWQEMEKQCVTRRSWQSMKSRYKDRLAAKQSDAVEGEVKEDDEKTAEENAEVEAECGADKPLSEADAAPHSAESDLTQIDVQSVPAGCSAENEDTQTAAVDRVEDQQDQEVDQQSDGKTVEAETSHSSQTKSENLQSSSPPRTSGTAEPEIDLPPTADSPQKQNLPKNSPPAQPKSTPKTSSSKKLRKKLEASPKLVQPQHRLTRRQLQLGALSSSPESYEKKLRSSPSSTECSTSSPQLLIKTRSAVKSAHQNNSADQPPLKKARGSVAEESQPDQSGPDTESKTAPAEESNPVPQKAEKRKVKRNLGILELATKEFEDNSESDKDEGPELQNPSETAESSVEPLQQPSNASADPTSTPETRPSPKENVPEFQVLSDNCVSDEGSSNAASAALKVPKPVSSTSEAHLFIFDSESQEDDSQSVVGDSSAAPSKPQPSVNKEAAFCLTQEQLEEDKQRIRDLMSRTNQDLVSVTKVLLKTSGDFSAALDLLLNPSSDPVLIWNRHDDHLLLSADPVVRQKLQEKYGEEKVAKRIMFLEVEG